jgi:hypothetical protein
MAPWFSFVRRLPANWAFGLGAGGRNQTRTVSLGIGPIRPVDAADHVVMVNLGPEAARHTSRRWYPVAELAAAFVLDHPAVGLDYLAGGRVVLIAGEQGGVDTE